MLLVDAELADSVAHIPVKHRVVLGIATDDEVFGAGLGEPEPWHDQDEDATATINYTRGTTARPKGLELTNRNLWTTSTTLAWHPGVSDRATYQHTMQIIH